MSDIDVGKTVGVVGLGAIGLLFVKLSKLKGARVIAVGRNPMKLKLAEEFGNADEIIDLTKCREPDKVIKELTPEKRGLDVAIEAVGLPEIWERAIALTRRGGTVNLFGGCESGTTIQIDTGRLHYDELRIISTFHHTPHHVSLAFRYIANHMLDLDKLITERMPLEKVSIALEKQKAGKVIKVAIKPNA
jgi:L-iditol 2-dehydrogenase